MMRPQVLQNPAGAITLTEATLYCDIFKVLYVSY